VVAEQAFPDQTAAGALMVFSRTDGAPLTGADQQRVADLTERLAGAGVPHVAGIATSPELRSPDQTIQLARVSLAGELSDSAVVASVGALRERAAPLLAGGPLELGVTGDAAMIYDSEQAFRDAERVVGVVTVGLVIGLLLLIFRSPVAALLPVLTVGLVLVITSSLIAALATAADVQVTQDLPVLLTVVLYGIGTDYTLFLLFRYRERLRAGDPSRRATATAVARVGNVIFSAASVVIIAFLVLLLASLGFFTTLGPGMAIGVAVMALAVLTLIPAVLRLIGPRVFWPSRSWRRARDAGVSRTAGRVVGRRPVLAAAGSGALLVGLAAAALAYTPSYDLLDQLPGDTESVRAFERLQQGFPAGALNPTQVYVRNDDATALTDAELARLGEALAGAGGVGSVAPAEFTTDRQAARIDVLLAERPLSNPALDAVGGPLREVAHAAAPAGTTVLVGGTTSTFADMRQAYERDLAVILPVAAALIALVLALLVRSLVAPWYLMAAVMVTFAASLGVGVLAVQVAGSAAGLIFILPIMLYLFVTAIGTDYNILMVARLREEAAAGADPRAAAVRSMAHAGPAIVAAALILAGTFAALLSSGVDFLTQLGLTVAVGILLAAVMALLLVPSLTALVGRRAWWPETARADAPRCGPARRGRHMAVRDDEVVLGPPYWSPTVGADPAGNELASGGRSGARRPLRDDPAEVALTECRQPVPGGRVAEGSGEPGRVGVGRSDPE
jgi:RND superfamily putative drug exporter